MSQWSRALETRAQVTADFLRLDLELGSVFADIALSAFDTLKRTRNTQNAFSAYNSVCRFMQRVALPDADFKARLENLKYKLVALGDMGEDVLGRRLSDRIRRLAPIVEVVPKCSPIHQRINERIKAELCEYFEREKNPQYGIDRRCQKGQ